VTLIDCWDKSNPLIVPPDFDCMPVNIVPRLDHSGIIIRAFDYVSATDYAVISVEVIKAKSYHDNEVPDDILTTPRTRAHLINVC
jgi:hypothetical protein